MGLIIKRWGLILPEVVNYFMYFSRVCNNGQHSHLRTTFMTDKMFDVQDFIAALTLHIPPKNV